VWTGFSTALKGLGASCRWEDAPRSTRWTAVGLRLFVRASSAVRRCLCYSAQFHFLGLRRDCTTYRQVLWTRNAHRDCSNRLLGSRAERTVHFVGNRIESSQFPEKFREWIDRGWDGFDYGFKLLSSQNHQPTSGLLRPSVDGEKFPTVRGVSGGLIVGLRFSLLVNEDEEKTQDE